jgi:hypothetical protein
MNGVCNFFQNRSADHFFVDFVSFFVCFVVAELPDHETHELRTRNPRKRDLFSLIPEKVSPNDQEEKSPISFRQTGAGTETLFPVGFSFPELLSMRKTMIESDL